MTYSRFFQVAALLVMSGLAIGISDGDYQLMGLGIVALAFFRGYREVPEQQKWRARCRSCLRLSFLALAFCVCCLLADFCRENHISLAPPLLRSKLFVVLATISWGLLLLDVVLSPDAEWRKPN